MKKRFFNSIIISSLLLLAGGAFALAANNDNFQKAKAEDVEVVLNWTGTFANNGSKNEIYLECTPENDIPKGWDEGALVQTSRDAFMINGEYTQDKYGKNLTMRKTGNYVYDICVDSIWALHNTIEEGDIIVAQGHWAQTGFDVTLTPICIKWQNDQWVKVDEYDVGSVDLSIKDSRKNNKNELYFAGATENLVPYNSDWSLRLNQGSNDCFLFNGVETKTVTGIKVQLMKLRADLYLIYIPDVGSPYNEVNTGDILVVQGIFVYQYSPKFVMHLHVPTISVTWNGSEWVLASRYCAQYLLDAGLCDGGNTMPDHDTWDEMATRFTYLGTDAVNEIRNATYTFDDEGHVVPGENVDQTVAEAVARYDYIIQKYGTDAYNDFAGRFGGQSIPASDSLNISFTRAFKNNNTYIIIVISSILVLSSVCLFFVLKRRYNKK